MPAASSNRSGTLALRVISSALGKLSLIFGAHTESVVASVVVVIAIVLLYRRIATIGKISVAFSSIEVWTVRFTPARCSGASSNRSTTFSTVLGIL